MARKIYKENELFNAAPYLKILEGGKYHPEENVLKPIESVSHLVEAAVSRKYTTLTFVGEMCGQPLKMVVDIDQSSRRTTYVTVTATVGEYTNSIHETDYCLHIGFDHFMDWVKTVIPMHTGSDIPDGVDVPVDMWAKTEKGKQFIQGMKDLGIKCTMDDQYGYDVPFEAKHCDNLLLLEYSEYIDHFRLIVQDEYYDRGDLELKFRAKASGAEPKFYVDDTAAYRLFKKLGFKFPKEFVAEWDDSYDRKPLHDYGMSPDKFLDTMQKLVKFNVDRIEKISKEHGGLTWRGMIYSNPSHKYDRPRDFKVLPKEEQERINKRIEEQQALRFNEHDKYFTQSKFGKIYKFLKEHGRVSPTPRQYGDDHEVEYTCPITLEVPGKNGELEKKTINVRGLIWVSGQCRTSGYTGRKYNAESFSMYIPMVYETNKGEFISWAKAKEAGSDMKYGGACYIDKKGRRSVTQSFVVNEYNHDDRWLDDDDIKYIEDVLLNIESDHEQYLKDCHLK